jgi:hypothetical protein
MPYTNYLVKKATFYLLKKLYFIVLEAISNIFIDNCRFRLTKKINYQSYDELLYKRPP